MTKLVAPADRSRSIPFRIVDGPSERGPRFGGRAPDAAEVDALDDAAVYVLTIPFTPELELSVFKRGELWDAMNAGIFADDRIVAVVHPPSARRSDDRFRSPLTEHAIVLGEEQSDASEEDEEKPRADHKLGGTPYCIQEPELEGAAGLTQVLQLDFPSADDGDISGSWPFADGMFNLLTPTAHGDARVFKWAFQK